MKSHKNYERADVPATIAVCKSYKEPLIDILGSYISITYCFLAHELLGKEHGSVFLKAKTFSYCQET